MCSPAPVMLAFGRDVEETFGIPTTFNQPGPGGVFLGIVGDQAHATRSSSHNCAPNQESSIDGVAYHPDYAHAWDARPRDRTHGMAMVRATLADPHDRPRYVIFDNTLFYPDGTSRPRPGHPTFHVSMKPGTHADIRPFFTEGGLTVAEVQKILDRLDEIEAKVVAIRAAQPGKAAFERLGKRVKNIEDGRAVDKEILAAIEAD